MPYTEKELRDALRAVAPDTYHSFNDLAGATLPLTMARVFEAAFIRIMRGELIIDNGVKSILLEAYDDLNKIGFSFR